MSQSSFCQSTLEINLNTNVAAYRPISIANDAAPYVWLEGDFIPYLSIASVSEKLERAAYVLKMFVSREEVLHNVWKMSREWEKLDVLHKTKLLQKQLRPVKDYCNSS